MEKLNWDHLDELARLAKDDQKVAARLYELCRPAILWQAKRMSRGGTGEVSDELISRLNVGFMLAVRGFRGDGGYRFIDFLHFKLKLAAWRLREKDDKRLVEGDIVYQSEAEDADMEAKMFGGHEDEFRLHRIEFDRFFETLDQKDKQLVYRIFRGDLMSEIGREEGVSRQAIHCRLKVCIDRYLKGRKKCTTR